MTAALARKFVRLGRDEDGAALVVTLALFMFMYAAVSGVFSLGQVVKNRIHLQNACDAAAYSAAVVQADTLSRIATINRAMAWTYVSMTRRQMDFVTCRWLEESVRHWKHDKEVAKDWAGHGTAVCSDAVHVGKQDHSFSSSDRPRITLYGATGGGTPETATTIDGFCSGFLSGHVGGDASFYTRFGMTGYSAMAGQIRDDRENIKEMGRAIDSLKASFRRRAVRTASGVLRANLAASGTGGLIENSFVFCDIREMPEYAVMLSSGGTSNEEDLFLSYVGESALSAFGNSGSAWFTRRDSEGVGFRRGYQWGGERLKAEWEWYSNQWHCKPHLGGDYDHIRAPVPVASFCKHVGHERCKCRYLGVKKTPHGDDGDFFRAVVYADNGVSKTGCVDIYETDEEYAARPNKLSDSYFGGRGTITVGLACYNENPWYRIFRSYAGIDGERGALRGIFGAFNPYRFVEWTWAFSSAKAGYRYKGDGAPARSYMVHLDSEKKSWNLCQSDWDAVFVPVRRAVSSASGTAESRGWTFLEGAPLESWIIGGEWVALGDAASMPAYSVAAMPDLPLMHDGSGAINTLDWGRLADLLYH